MASVDDKCPVDPQTRQKWLDAAKANGQQAPHPPKQPAPASLPPQAPTAQQLRRAENNPKMLEQLTPQMLRMPQEQRNILLQQWQDLRAMSELHALGRTRFSLDSGSWTLPPTTQSEASTKPRTPTSTLPTDREISSIPRALSTTRSPASLNSAERAALPANSESDTGHDSASGNWIYPSQSQFFSAMQRKGHTPTAADMQTIVPIHNAVNERTWREILRWEEPYHPHLSPGNGEEEADGPRLVEYVIDFYEGRGEDGKGGGGAGPLSFYLDVRPKLNSWEGVRTRVGRAVGV
ncbi:Cytochrome c1 heme lyase [Saxophila tyrrhenica]|uniref:Holocytochrome c-type synthase n=1 Tax=Saxophila tyrrhenica TaxID=1690608 RepID=A0AAV9PEG1_9PEZI|nr:Cytochrome c1 heme lyase [Saxophila tyrrhenica]